MLTLLNWLERWTLTCRMKLRERGIRRAARSSPSAFRRLLILPGDDGRALGERIEPWQARDFEALDAAWLHVAGRSGPRGVRRAYIERPRGHSKTSDMAVQLAWILLFARRAVRGIAAAADRDQAGLIGAAIERIARLNPLMCGALEFRKHVVRNQATGSRLEIISSDVQSSWGALPDFVICDELCHWEKPDLWYSLLSAAAKQAHCVLAVLTNAGVGQGWQWAVRERARESSAWYFSSLSGSQAPWISAELLEEQRLMLPPPVFDRLWRNLWQHSDGEFVTLAEAEACRDDALAPREWGEPRVRYVAAIDYAEKRDYTVGVVVHREEENVFVDRMDVVVPTAEEPTPVSWVDAWMAFVASRFPDVEFVVDEYQLLGTIQRLGQLHAVHRFEFAGGRGNHELALLLRKLIVQRRIRWCAGCGQLEGCADRDDLETELASLLLKQLPSGRCRIDHRRDAAHHDDRAFALGAACLRAMEGHDDWMEITPPDAGGGFDW